MNWLRRLIAYRPRLLTRVALALGLVSLVPLGFLAWRMLGLTESAMVEQILRTHAVAVRTASDRIDSYFATRQAAGEATVRKLAAEPGRAAEILVADMEALSPLGLRAAQVVNQAGEEVVRVQDKTMDKEFLLRALTRPQRHAIAILPELAAQPLLRIDLPIEGQGSLRMLFDSSPLSAVLLTPEIGRQADLVLVDEDRQSVLGNGAVLGSFPPNVVENALTGKVGEAARQFRDAQGRSFLGASSPLTVVPWAVLSRQPSQIAEETIANLRRAAWLGLSGALALIALLATAAYYGLVRPIRLLTQAQRSLAKGEVASGGDELTDLTRSFRVLEQRMRDREALDRVFLGRYQVVDVQGGGAMGTLFRGWDPRLDRPVAIKTVRLAGTDAKGRDELRQRLLREAVTTARFSHPNIVAVYDATDSPEGAFIAMEFVDGCSLARLLRRMPIVVAEQTAILGAAVARGLAAAHAHHIVHRDVTPGNILLGRAGAIKLGDFGVAEIQSLAESRAGRVFGTPGFIPPEACVGEGFGARGDVFSLGVVLYLCLTGRNPFSAHTVTQVLARTVACEIVAPRALDAAIPPGFEQLVLRLLARLPAERPDAAEAAAELEGFAAATSAVWKLAAVVNADESAAPRPVVDPARQWMQTLGGPTRPA